MTLHQIVYLLTYLLTYWVIVTTTALAVGCTLYLSALLRSTPPSILCGKVEWLSVLDVIVMSSE